MTYKGKEITEDEITVDVIREILIDYMPSVLRQNPFGFPYHKKYNNIGNILSPALVLDDFCKYLHNRHRHKDITDIESCIKLRVKEHKYTFRSKEYLSFISFINKKRRDNINSKIEERIEKAPEVYQSYSDQLDDPRWYAFRKFIFIVRKNRCERCGSRKSLQVHHPKYISGRKAWEYTCNEVIVLCKECHQKEHNIKPEST